MFKLYISRRHPVLIYQFLFLNYCLENTSIGDMTHVFLPVSLNPLMRTRIFIRSIAALCVFFKKLTL